MENKMVQESRLELRGIDFIPEEDRKSKPMNLFFVLGGAQYCYPIMLIGALPVLFGLGWWDSFFAITIGLLVGCVVVAPISLFGQKTGTNGIVSSGAHFGTKGRIVGAVLTVIVAIGFYSLVVWTGAESIVYGGNKLLGLPKGQGSLAIGALLICILISIVATFGHSLVVVIEKIGTWVLGAILLLTLLVFSPQFDASYHGGNYLLGGYWATWLLSASVALSIPISLAPFINDYTRYVPGKTSARSIMFGTGAGIFMGCWITMICAAYVTTILNNPDTPLIQGIIEMSPAWFVLPLILMGLVGSLTQGSFCIYGAGLGLETMGWGINRILTTVIVSIVSIIVVFFAVFVYDLLDLINAFVTLIVVAISPWLTIKLVGYYLVKGQYDPLDLHQAKGGSYWYSNGYNIPAIISWVLGLIVGLLFTNTTVFAGPLANTFGGIDVSFVSSAILGAALFFILSKKSVSKQLKTIESKGEIF
ncbi:purine-cytosine permease family protein [Neobacillus terrae]|uniref:purine-cytosine permease family protein n=1 Tax=Neobacillus terrae TaxID=3034837 RepID=UPI00140B82FB|nr:cytosine permease [Neobacillus terrae]NHM31357.1 nitrate reductase [Neobacillus terrae]